MTEKKNDQQSTSAVGSELSGGLGRLREKAFLPLRFFMREKGQGCYLGILEMWDYKHWGNGWTFLALDWGEEGFKVRFCDRG